MSNYIMDLRKVVGHAPLLQAAASIIIENENGQVRFSEGAQTITSGATQAVL